MINIIEGYIVQVYIYDSGVYSTTLGYVLLRMKNSIF